MDAWIDVYQDVRALSRGDSAVFITDNAVGAGEEENLSHLLKNVGGHVSPDLIVPFLTLKHSHEYCLNYARRARRAGFPGLVILGGDAHDGVPRCLPHSWQLREQIDKEHPSWLLGGWVNPFGDPVKQIGYLVEHQDSLDFVLTQIQSHHTLDPAARLLEQAERQGLEAPLVAGVFYYRSARRKTLRMLSHFIPVPEAEIIADFGERGLEADQVAAQTVKALLETGFRRFYISNLASGRARKHLSSIARLAGIDDPMERSR